MEFLCIFDYSEKTVKLASHIAFITGFDGPAFNVECEILDELLVDFGKVEGIDILAGNLILSERNELKNRTMFVQERPAQDIQSAILAL